MNDIEPRLWGGIGEKKSNDNTQWYQQDRIYDADYIAISVTTCFHPYYLVKENMKLEDKIKRLYNSEKEFIDHMNDVQEMKLEFENDKFSHAKLTHNGIAYPVTTRVGNCNYYIIMKEKEMNEVKKTGNYKEFTAVGIPEEDSKTRLKIRKLTGKECYRLMGFSDTDADRAAEVISEGLILHTAGDSIVVNVLMAIIKQML